MNFKSLFPLSAACGVVFLLAGCSGSGISSNSGPGVRVINGLNTVSEADVTVGTIVVGSPLPYATVSGTPAHPYAIIPIGSQTLNFANINAPSTSLISAAVNLTVQQDIDAIAYTGPNGTTPQFLTLYDNLTIPTDAMVRLVNASGATGSVDIILTPPGASAGTTTTLAAGGIFPAQISQPAPIGTYTDLPISGAYNLKIYHAGNDTGTPLVNETVTLPTGSSWTLVVLDPPTGQTAPAVLQVQDNLLYDSAP